MKEVIKILYKNYRNETAWRTIEPKHILFHKTDYHPTPQWMLTAWDIDKKVRRDFAMADIIKWDYGYDPSRGHTMSQESVDSINKHMGKLNGKREFKDFKILEEYTTSEPNGLLCCKCHKPQSDTQSGPTCENGHGGEMGYCDEPKEGLSKECYETKIEPIKSKDGSVVVWGSKTVSGTCKK